MSEQAQLPVDRAARRPANAVLRRLERVAFLVGSAGLLIAMGADALAVLGRHLGVPLLGSIEIVQASVVLVASAAMIAATLRGSHARVHLLLSRLNEAQRCAFERIADAASALVFMIFACGSIWIAAELWQGHELTDLLHIPLRWLRVFWIAISLLIVALLLARIVRSDDRST
jgi:TRAP-type C4-dicarboxylate transport system permease small subunit